MINFFTAVARVLAAVALLAGAGSAAAQQTYPGKPIRLVVPYPPGGSTDPVARMVAQRLTERWGQPVIVDNRPGGNTVIGTDAVAKAPPDGYTMLLVTGAFVIIPGLIPSLPYDTLKDLDAVATLARLRYVLVLHPSLPAISLQQFIALAKSRPGQLNYASAGAGGVNHLAGELFDMVAGTRMQHIPYKGGGPAITELVGGQVEVSFQVPIAVIAHINSGKLKAIAITGSTRATALPQVRTFAEAGLPAYEMTSWFGIVAPAATPRDIADKWSRELATVLAMSDFREKLVSQGLETYISAPEQFAALLRADMAKWSKVIKAAKVRVEN